MKSNICLSRVLIFGPEFGNTKKGLEGFIVRFELVLGDSQDVLGKSGARSGLGAVRKWGQFGDWIDVWQFLSGMPKD